MRLERLGDLAVLVDGLTDPVAYARVLNRARPQGLLEAVPAYETLGLYFAECPVLEQIQTMLADLKLDIASPSKRVDIPCRYDGPDLQEVAEMTGLLVSEVISLHSNRDYRCYALGFTPGFAYLGYLDDQLALQRRSEPRVRVPAGSVAIAGRQTAVYPQESPGGWWLIGTTEAELADPSREYFAIEVGDLVRFVA